MDQKHAEVHARAAEISIDLAGIKRIAQEQKEKNDMLNGGIRVLPSLEQNEEAKQNNEQLNENDSQDADSVLPS